MTQSFFLKVIIEGMTCASCEVLIERELQKIPGIRKVQVNHTKQNALIHYDQRPSINDLQNALSDHNYKVSPLNQITTSSKQPSAPPGSMQISLNRNHLEVGAIFLIFMAGYLLLKQFELLPNLSVKDDMTYGFVFLIGLVAAMSSCLAVTGGLLVAVAAKYNEAHKSLSVYQKFLPTLFFNVGRVVGYTGFGAAVGALGGALTFSIVTTGWITIFASILMLVLGFQMLDIFPFFKRFQLKMPKFIAHRIHNLSESQAKATPAVLGALTFFLPCGFTQALQIYVLSQGDAYVGALTMLVFSLGTLPSLMSLSILSSYIKGNAQKYFMKTAGVLVVLVGITTVGNGYALIGSPIDFTALIPEKKIESAQARVADPNVKLVDGVQIVEMQVLRYDYVPHKFTIKKGIPVEWRIDAKTAAGCGRILVAPKIGVNEYLSNTKMSTIKFTPKKTGKIPFNCSMGMMTRGAGFTVVE